MIKRCLFFIILLLGHAELSSCGNKDEAIGVMSANATFDFNPTSEYIAIFGDIQYYTNNTYGSLYRHSTDWLLEQKQRGMDIKCVLHTGDITQGNALKQWTVFEEHTKEMAAVIPYFSMIGDHDYTWEDIYINDRQSTLFNDFVKFPLSMQKVVAQFEEGRMENIVVENTIHSHRLDFLILEFGPRNEVLEWADAYVKANPETMFILMTHEYLEKGGGRRTERLKSKIRLRNTTFTTPDELWNNLIRCNDNIRCVLCGHVGGLYAVTEDENDSGRVIAQIQHNIQSPDYRYDNWLMLWEFPKYSNLANVFIYNTKTNQYYNGQHVLFAIPYTNRYTTDIKKVNQINTPSYSYSLDGVPSQSPVRHHNRISVSKGHKTINNK